MGELDKTTEEEKLTAILQSINSSEFSDSSFQATLFDLLQSRKGKHVIDTLLQAEADISAQISESSPLEQIDISNTHKHIVQLLVNSADNCHFYDGKVNQTVLHFASKYGWLGVVQSLLKKGADPNVKDFYGDTPLMLAAQSVHKDVAELLIESGADVLCRSNVNYTLLHAASEKGWLEFAQTLLNKGLDPNTATKRGFTPLDFAMRRSNKYVVSLLMGSGANPNICKLSSDKLLELAAEEGHLQVLQDFIQKNRPRHSIIFNFLNIAYSREQFETIEYLVKHLIMIIESDVSPFQFIVNTFHPNLKVIQSFIEGGAYFDGFENVSKFDLLKVCALQNVQVCTQAIINKFNNKDLPDLYKLPLSIANLPPIKKFIIKSRGIVQDIEQSVRSEIETSGHCNVVNPKVILLSMMSVKAYIAYCNDLKKSKMKRSASVESDDEFETPRKVPCRFHFECID